MCAAVLAGPVTTEASPTFLTAWTTRYPTSTLPARMQAELGSRCYVCHIPPSNATAGSCYRLDIRTARQGGAVPIAQALAAVEDMDSDGDGVSNVEEILMPRTDLPGEVGYHPGLTGPEGVSPCGPTPTTPLTYQLESPPFCPGDFNRSGQTNVQDLFDFLAAFFGGEARADFNATGDLSVQDLYDFLAAFFTACP
jgi:hypothetical protein